MRQLVRGNLQKKAGAIVMSVAIFLSEFTFAKEEMRHAEQLKQQIQLLQKELMQPVVNQQVHTDSSKKEVFTHAAEQHSPLLNKQQEASLRALNEAAFDQAMQNALPLSAQQISYLKQQFNKNQVAVAADPNVPPRPVIASRYINLSPGSTPMVIRLAQGYVSTLAFLDSSGQPWPIESYTIGDPQAFNVQWDKKSSLMMIKATMYNTGNLAVQLQGLHVPIMLTLISGQKAVDYRLDIRVQGAGPNAKPLLGRALPPHVATELLGILDGVPPAENTALQVTGGMAQAWLVGNRLYLRTRLTVLSPAWLSTLSSLDGMKAYELPKTSLILGSANGQTVQLKLQGL